jgi:hypothetical protein
MSETLPFWQQFILQIIPTISGIVMLLILFKFVMPKLLSMLKGIGKMEKENNCNCSKCQKERTKKVRKGFPNPFKNRLSK